jgi:serralysin
MIEFDVARAMEQGLSTAQVAVLDGIVATWTTRDPVPMFGGNGPDTFAGRAGDDIIFGGLGADVMDYSGSPDGVVVDLAAQRAHKDGYGNVDQLYDLANVVGSAFEDLIVGDAAANVLRGGAGRDVLIGRGGDDVLYGGEVLANELYGGPGDDRYIVEVAGDTIVELPDEGSDAVETALPVFRLPVNVEYLRYTGLDRFVGLGNAGDNVLVGGPARDVLLGLDGNDVLMGGVGEPNELSGGRGDDLYIVEAAGDTIVELADEGGDTVETALPVFGLPENVENLRYTGLDGFVGLGNVWDNLLVGGLARDVLLGLDGDDVLMGGPGEPNELYGGRGDDRYVVDAAGDTIVESAGEGNDTVEAALPVFRLPANVENLAFAGSGNFRGTGNELDNLIRGGDGDDVISGGAGDDWIEGGAGTDTAVFADALEHYSFEVVDGAHVVTHVPHGDYNEGVDRLYDIEYLVFSDGTPVPIQDLFGVL